MFIVIEGLPRTGKTTVAAEIARRLGIRHCKSRPPEHMSIDDYVIGKADAFAHIDWNQNWLIMDRQLASSYAFTCQRGEILKAKAFLEWDKVTPCTYIYLQTNDEDIHRIVDRTHEDGYHGQPHEIGQAFEFQAYLSIFFDNSTNPIIDVSIWDENDVRKSVDQLASEIIEQLPRPSWDEYFMHMVETTRHRSTCLSRRVGAIATLNNRILGIGYNGAPSGAEHCASHNCGDPNCGSNGGERTVHAEINALINAEGSLRGGTIYSSTEPCLSCTKMLINAGIVRVVYKHEYRKNTEVRDDLVREAGIEWTKV
tara:strand:- start:4418 stop:5353 length:936 start_codon:yes stop_codon:yes gene_type:complete